MRRLISTVLGLAAAALSTAALAQNPEGVNVGSLQCRVAGGMGFVFGSSKDMDCLLRAARRQSASAMSAPSTSTASTSASPRKRRWSGWCSRRARSAKGALAGDYGGATASAAVGAGVGANVLVGGSSKQITLQPVSVEGSAGLNVAAGVAAVTLKPAQPAKWPLAMDDPSRRAARRLTPRRRRAARRGGRAGGGGGAGLQRRQPRRDDGDALRPRGFRPRLHAHRAPRREAVGNLRHRGRADGPRHRGQSRDRQPSAWPALQERRRTLAGRTGCGLCGVDSLEAALRPVPATRATATVSSGGDRAGRWRRCRREQRINRDNGATHAAGWATLDGTLVTVREDVGRHNALDKLAGAHRRSWRSRAEAASSS